MLNDKTDQYSYEERASILEYEAKLSRKQAEFFAKRMTDKINSEKFHERISDQNK